MLGRRAALTPAQRTWAINCVAGGEAKKVVAKRYGISISTLYKMIERASRQPFPKRTHRRKGRRPAIKPSAYQVIFRRCLRGETQKAIAADYGVSPATISRVLSKEVRARRAKGMREVRFPERRGRG